jgi:hypothetical protein
MGSPYVDGEPLRNCSHGPAAEEDSVTQQQFADLKIGQINSSNLHHAQTATTTQICAELVMSYRDNASAPAAPAG